MYYSDKLDRDYKWFDWKKKMRNDNFTTDDTVLKSEDVAYTFTSYFVNIGPNLANKLNTPNENNSTFRPEPSNSSLFF